MKMDHDHKPDAAPKPDFLMTFKEAAVEFSKKWNLDSKVL
jgi:hypothetical protein